MSFPHESLCALSAAHLGRLLRVGEVSAVEVVKAHLERIDALDGRVRALTHVFRQSALRDAERADAERRQGSTRGPLHGVPVTFKESIDFAGQPTTLGLPSRLDTRAHEDAVVVQMLREAGAIPLGRTNVSQLLFSYESRNPLFGRTANPFSLKHSAGGSSGGDAAALASGMSPLSVGSDLHGCLRVPAHFSGVCGLKPTLDRWPCRGSTDALPGQETLRAMVGPMARTVEDLCLLLGAINPRQVGSRDARVPPVHPEDPFRLPVEGLRVGFFTDNGLVAPGRALVRAVERACKALEARGCHLVPFTPPGYEQALLDGLTGLTADGGVVLRAALEGGEVDEVLGSDLERLSQEPGEERVRRHLQAMRPRPVDELWAVTWRLRQYRQTLLAELDRAGVDLVLCPPFATAALPHGASRDFALAGSYAMFWNVVQFPAGVVPVTRVGPAETERSAGGDFFQRRAAEVDAASEGLPVGVQVAGRPWTDALVLAVMAVIEAEVKDAADFPRTPASDTR
jgi:fatty acid amide hydrolase